MCYNPKSAWITIRPRLLFTLKYSIEFELISKLDIWNARTRPKGGYRRALLEGPIQMEGAKFTKVF